MCCFIDVTATVEMMLWQGGVKKRRTARDVIDLDVALAYVEQTTLEFM